MYLTFTSCCACLPPEIDCKGKANDFRSDGWTIWGEERPFLTFAIFLFLKKPFGAVVNVQYQAFSLVVIGYDLITSNSDSCSYVLCVLNKNIFHYSLIKDLCLLTEMKNLSILMGYRNGIGLLWRLYADSCKEKIRTLNSSLRVQSVSLEIRQEKGM